MIPRDVSTVQFCMKGLELHKALRYFSTCDFCSVNELLEVCIAQGECELSSSSAHSALSKTCRSTCELQDSRPTTGLLFKENSDEARWAVTCDLFQTLNP